MSLPYHLDPDERIDRTVRHHPMSLVPGIISAGVLVLAAFALLVVPSLPALAALPLGIVIPYGFFAILAIVILGIACLVAAAAWLQYVRNYLVLTNKNIIIVQQQGLFNQNVSQKGLHNIEDVKAFRRGVGPTIFNYGTLQVSTASDNETHFYFAPNPARLADDILAMQNAETAARDQTAD